MTKKILKKKKVVGTDCEKKILFLAVMLLS